MSVRVRFAPSPTGHLHIGGARTALYSYLFAKANNGKFILRVEDTDQDRSKKEFEQSQIDDLKWCGLEYDEGPDKEGEYGPYRQSERLDTYKKYAHELVDKGHAYYCFCDEIRLEELKTKAEENNQAPHYDRHCLSLNKDEVELKIKREFPHVIRFKVPEKTYSVKDHVRGEVSWPQDMVGDFILLRSNGLPTYNFCCVIDDHLMKISHVIRAEEHLNNTLRQLMIYEAIGANPPEFAHCSLLVGKDRQKLSKRHGATSVSLYRQQNYLPEAMMNYLLLLGWSHPEEKDIFDYKNLGNIFDLNRFSKSPALYDLDKLNYFNGQYMRALSDEQLIDYIGESLKNEHEFSSKNKEWKQKFCLLFKDKIQLPSEASDKLDLIFSTELEESDAMKEIMLWDTTIIMKSYLREKVLEMKDTDYLKAETVDKWLDHLKKELKIKGKPLFKGVRALLTGHSDGPDLKALLSITPCSVIKKRL
ncbi:MAG: glutamate--tRNA ligase [Bacteriovoracaceae bacterium]